MIGAATVIGRRRRFVETRCAPETARANCLDSGFGRELPDREAEVTLELEAATSALVLIDLQQGVLGLTLSPHPAPAVLAAAVGLGRRFQPCPPTRGPARGRRLV